MEKVISWAKEHKVALFIVFAILVIAGLAYHFRESFMPGISSDATANIPDTTPVDKNLLTPETPDRPVFKNEPLRKDELKIMTKDFAGLIPSAAKSNMMVMKMVTV
jgi:hypothetical protein